MPGNTARKRSHERISVAKAYTRHTAMTTPIDNSALASSLPCLSSYPMHVNMPLSIPLCFSFDNTLPCSFGCYNFSLVICVILDSSKEGCKIFEGLIVVCGRLAVKWGF